MDNCVLCGKEVHRGGYSTRVEGVILRPLCPDCDQLCSKDPKRILDEHREVFERMLAERREALAPPTASAAAPEAPRRSQRERKLIKRYDDAYVLANTTVRIGNAIKIIGLVFATVIVLVSLFVMLLSTTETKGVGGDVGLGVVGIVVAGIVGMVCYALGTLVAAVGQTLQASLDIAVSSSPFLTNDLKAEVMAV
jgi:hypothetical protein